MDYAAGYYAPERRPAHRYRRPPPAARWVKEWIPQDLASTGGKCSLFRWVREDMLDNIKQMAKEREMEAKPEPTTEILFLCSHEGCGKTFVDVGALRKHAHVHAEKQHACQYPGCGKKFTDSSKLKRHYLIHTGEKDYVCPYEGCGKAFSLDFNLKSHMKTHAAENYHVCPFLDCGKRFTSDSKLRSHVKVYHEKSSAADTVRHTPPAEKTQYTSRTPASVYTPASLDRPFVCPHKGCGKAYIHEYKLNLHLRNQHPNENGKPAAAATPSFNHAMDDASDLDYTAAVRGSTSRSSSKRSRPNPNATPALLPALPLPPARVSSRSLPALPVAAANCWPGKQPYRDDSEETEEEQDDENNGGDEDETEDED